MGREEGGSIKVNELLNASMKSLPFSLSLSSHLLFDYFFTSLVLLLVVNSCILYPFVMRYHMIYNNIYHVADQLAKGW